MSARHVFLLLLFGLCSISLFAEEQQYEDAAKYKRVTIAWDPIALFANGNWHVEVEAKHKKNCWFVGGFSIYDRSPLVDYYWYDAAGVRYDAIKYKGAGGNIGYKYYLFLDFISLTGNLSYTSVNAEYSYYGWTTFVEDGLSYCMYDKHRNAQQFYNVSTDVKLGFQTPLRGGFFAGIYLGVGYYYSFYDKNKVAFNDDSWGLGYRGFSTTASAKIGVAF